MNIALSNSYGDYCLPAHAPATCLKPFPVRKDLDDDIHILHFHNPANNRPTLTPLPVKTHPVLDVDRTAVSASLMRRIEHELRNDQCDARTVFNHCRGLIKGSRDFEDAYIAARIRSFAKHQRIAIDPLVITPPYTEEWPVNKGKHTLNLERPTPLHPMAVNHLGHLMAHFGIWVIGLLGLQFLAAWRIGAFANSYLEGGRIFYFLLAAFLMMALNSAIWFLRRGNLCNAFLIPGSLLYVMALLPIIIFHVRETVLAMR